MSEPLTRPALLAPNGTTPLPHWGVFSVRGADAGSFLQGQLTRDVLALDDASFRLAGFCSAKGRLQASFLLWRPAADEWCLACSASLIAATVKRLSMFVLRAKAKLAEEPVRIFGAVGTGVAGLIDGAVEPWQRREVDGATVLRLPDVDGIARAMVIEAPGSADTTALASAAGLTEPGLALDTWRRLEVRAGIATIEAATVDRFVPQMLNYELLGGIDFQKGCYPGQEVVARSQYRGTLKRRTFLFEADAPGAAGMDVYTAAEPEQPVGTVAEAALQATGSGSVLLVELKLAALDGPPLRLGTAEGAVLRRIALPYDVPMMTAGAG